MKLNGCVAGGLVMVCFFGTFFHFSMYLPFLFCSDDNFNYGSVDGCGLLTVSCIFPSESIKLLPSFGWWYYFFFHCSEVFRHFNGIFGRTVILNTLKPLKMSREINNTWEHCLQHFGIVFDMREMWSMANDMKIFRSFIQMASKNSMHGVMLA